MKVGSPKEIKNHEYRVGLIPPTVTELKKYGHEVFIQSEAGLGVGFSDNDYKAAGAKIFKDARSIFEECDIIVKVKEPQKEERKDF